MVLRVQKQLGVEVLVVWTQQLAVLVVLMGEGMRGQLQLVVRQEKGLERQREQLVLVMVRTETQSLLLEEEQARHVSLIEQLLLCAVVGRLLAHSCSTFVWVLVLC